MRAIALFTLLLAPLLLAAPSDKPRVIFLSDGTRIIGKIAEDECTDEQLVVRELRGGAKRRIPWSDLKPDQASDLRVELGFEIKEASQGELKLEGHQIRNRAGSVFEGMLLNPDTAAKDGVYRLKTAQGVLKIRVTDVVRGPTPTRIDALAVYTGRELYEKRLKEKAPKTAEDHFLLAEYCVAVDALDEAKSHYEKALELDDPKYTRDKIQRSLDRIDRLLANRDAHDELKAIRSDIHYNRFADAKQGLAAFQEKYASKPDMLEEAERLAKELETERDDYYVTRVPRALRDGVRDKLASRVKESDEWTLREAMKYAAGEASAEDSVTRHVIEEVAAEMGIEPEEVLEYWNRRSKRSMQKAFYRDGTFVVVDNLEDALAKAPKIKKPKGGGNVKLPKPRKMVTPDAWFESKLKARRYSDLRDWLYAFWAERSGMCEVLDPKEETCPTCNGKGYVQTMISTGGGSVPFFDRCGTCHMARHFRIVRFR